MRCSIRLARRAYPRWTLTAIFVLASGLPAFALSVTSGPTLTMDPNGTTPLAGVVALTTDVPTRVLLQVSSTDGTDAYTVNWPHLGTRHTVPVLGLKPDRTYRFKLTVVDQANTALPVTPLLGTTTQPLPAGFPRLDVLASQPAKMEPGYTLLRATGSGGPDYTIILDAAGAVVWYSSDIVNDTTTLGIRLPNGELLYRSVPRGELLQTDLLGNARRRLTLPSEIPDGITHHDMFRTAAGTFLSLMFKPVSVPAYPTSYTDPTSLVAATIRDTPVVEFSARGVLLGMWDLSSMLDTSRIGYGGLHVTAGGALDWTHANSVVEDTRDGGLIVSLRHQDAVVKFSRSGELIWILGTPANWGPAHEPYLLRPVGTPFEYPYHQHNATITPHGTLLMFDNGNGRASPFDGTQPMSWAVSYSRAVEYAVDEQHMEVRQVWEHGSPATRAEVLFSVALSGAQSLPQTGNVLITFGDTIYAGGVSSAGLGLGTSHARIIETDRALPASTLFDVRMYRTGATHDVKVYRSYRIPGLYAAPARLVDCHGLPATLVGTPGDDLLEGTPADDVIVGLGGNDTISGHGGEDVLCGSGGADRLQGDGGADQLYGGSGNDELYGWSGPDQLHGEGGDDRLYGGGEADLLRGGAGSDHLHGGPGSDQCIGGAGGATMLSCE